MSLIECAKTGDVDKFNELVKRGDVNIDETDADGWPPILWAARNGHLEMVRALIRKGANLNFQSFHGKYSALILATACCYPEIVHELIISGAELDLKDLDDYTAMDWAKEYKNNNLTQMIEEDSNNITKKFEQTRAMVKEQIDEFDKNISFILATSSLNKSEVESLDSTRQVIKNKLTKRYQKTESLMENVKGELLRELNELDLEYREVIEQKQQEIPVMISSSLIELRRELDVMVYTAQNELTNMTYDFEHESAVNHRILIEWVTETLDLMDDKFRLLDEDIEHKIGKIRDELSRDILKLQDKALNLEQLSARQLDRYDKLVKDLETVKNRNCNIL